MPALIEGRQGGGWSCSHASVSENVQQQPSGTTLVWMARTAGPAVLCLLEVDRGTMPVRRAGLARSSFRRKLLAYEATWRQDLHRSRFGFDRMRVLTVAHSEARMRNLIEEARLLESGHGLFLFTTDELLRASCPLAAVWHPVPGDGMQRLLAS